MRTFYYLYRFYRRGGMGIVPAIRRAARTISGNTL